MNHRNIAVLVNSKAGKGKAVRIFNRIAKQLSLSDTVFTLFKSDWPQSLNAFSDIFLVGGDGTVNFFLNKYPLVTVPITLFKGGSGNDFAWKLYGNISFDQLFEAGMNGPITAIDAGICNGKLFINGMGVGFDGKVVQAMGSKKIISAGHIAYMFTVLRQILFFKEFPVQIIHNENITTLTAFMISIANGSRYGGGFIVAPEAKVNDGELNVVIIRKLSLIKRLRYLPVLKKGKHMDLPFVDTFRCTVVEVFADHIIHAHLDGELLESKHFRISILPSRFYFRIVR